MIALAILFIIIIGLLVVVIRLLQNFFAGYGNMYASQYQSGETFVSKNETGQLNEEINNLAKDREAALEECFTSLENSKIISPQKTDVLIQSLKIYLQSILKLLKTE